MASVSWDDLRKEAEAAGSGFELINAGSYEVVVKKATPKQSQAGNEQIMVQFEVISGPNKGYSGLFDYLTFTKAAASVVLGKLSALQVAIPSGGDLDITALARDLIGATATADVVQDDYNGQTRNKIKSLKPSGNGGIATNTATGFPF